MAVVLAYTASMFVSVFANEDGVLYRERIMDYTAKVKERRGGNVATDGYKNR